MPSSAVQKFTEPDEYAPAGQHAHTRLLAIKRPVDFGAKFTSIELPNLRVNQFSDTLPRVARIGIVGDRILFGFLAQPGAGPITGGIEMMSDKLHQMRAAGQEFYHQTPDSSSYVTVSLPAVLMTDLDDLAGRVPTHSDLIKHAPPPAALAKLRRLNEAAGALAEDAPAVLASLEAARSLEQAFIGALVACFDGDESREDRTASRQHTAIMRRFYQAIEECSGQPLYVPEVCKAVGASERTLRTCCEEHLGMGPKHYLLLRRLHLFRRALWENGPGDTTVTELATRYGFWQFGRLAVEYKALFGEAPSVTLARPI
jgi:AraC-like DNA-binding protein